MEKWQEIEGYVGRYEASSLGRIRSLDMTVRRSGKGNFHKKGRILSPTFSYGYPYVTLCKNGEQVRKSVAVIICETFHGPRPEGYEVAHGNGKPDDVRERNLRWASKSSNAADKKRHGTENFGETHPRAKISEAQAIETIELLRGGMSQHKIARKLGITRGIVCAISLNQTWRHLPR